MAKFFYKMQNILTIKAKLEEQAKTTYSQAQAKVYEEEEKLLVLENRKEQYENQLRESMSSTLNIFHIRKWEEAVEIMKFEINKQKVHLNAALQQLELASIALNKAMIERKTQEKLRENAFEDFQKECKITEGKEVDELVAFRFGNKNREEEE